MTKIMRIYALLFVVFATGVIISGCSGGDDLKPLPEDSALKNMPAGEYVPPPGAGGGGGQPMPGSKKGGG